MTMNDPDDLPSAARSLPSSDDSRSDTGPAAKSARGLVSVGRVATETGISSHTLRVWERRYGTPMPVRLPSGHRRYTLDQVAYLRLVAEGIALGFRPGRLLRAKREELEKILESHTPPREPLPSIVVAWLRLLESFDSASLVTELKTAARRLGPLDFLETQVAPLLREVGLRWSEGKLDIRHEHLCTQVVEDVLRDLRRDIEKSVPSVDRRIILAALPDERHGLGISMAAVVCALNGIRTTTLGTDTPAEEIVGAVTESGANAVGLSLSSSSGTVDSLRAISELRRVLDHKTLLLLGGEGLRRVRRKMPGVESFSDLRQFDEWLGKHMGRRATGAAS